jgi:hydroxymethylpyrimidine/phosphomethylpyrimidine kinase
MHHFCLAIAGSDPSSGAGIQADIRTLDRIGVHPFSIITAITYQSANKFYGYYSLSDELDSQFKSLFDNYPIKFAKIGMIPDEKSVEIITKYIKKYELKIVFDPVTISSAGKRLASEGLENTLKKKLFPLVSVLTPNIMEAYLYTNTELKRINSSDPHEIKKIAMLLLKNLYNTNLSFSKSRGVIIKSAWKEKSNIFDLLCLAEDSKSDPEFHTFKKQKISLNKNVHGSGCVFSSAIAGYLAKNYTFIDAIKSAETFFDDKFQKFIQLHDGGNLIDLTLPEKELNIIEQIKEIYLFLSNNKRFSVLIPEVRMNISGALPNATEKKDIAAIEGRITIIDGYPYAQGEIKFGVSDHTARLILEAKKFDQKVNFAMNLKYNDDWISLLREKSNLQLKEIKRDEQPREVKSKEYSTMQWIIQKTIKETGKIPDIIWDKGAMGKEPIIRLFGNNSKDIIQKLNIISKTLQL